MRARPLSLALGFVVAACSLNHDKGASSQEDGVTSGAPAAQPAPVATGGGETSPAAGPAARARPRGPLDGTWLYFGNDTDSTYVAAAEIPPLLDELADLGMNTLVLSATRFKRGDCSSGTFHWVQDVPAKLGVLLDEAEKRGMAVYVGTTSTSDACAAFIHPSNARAVAEDVRASAAELERTYGAKPAFAGWYIPDEPSLGFGIVHPFYHDIHEAIAASSDKPVVVAPYLKSATGLFSPEEVASIAKGFLEATKSSRGRPLLQAWQDSVGASSVPLPGWSRDRGLVEEYFAAIAQAIGKENLWSDNELFGGPVPEFANGPYAPASVVRLNQQLWSTRYDYVSKRLSWLAQIHMTTTDPHHHPEANRLRAAFKALYGMEGEYVHPASYRWITPPDAQYPDSGGELTDMHTGDPKDYRSAGWVGVSGGAQFHVELGGEKNIDWVATHLLSNDAVGVALPASLEITCLDGAGAAKATHTATRPFAQPAPNRYEYVLGNLEPLGMTCSALDVRLPGPQWTFVSEVEIVAKK